MTRVLARGVPVLLALAACSPRGAQHGGAAQPPDQPRAVSSESPVPSAPASRAASGQVGLPPGLVVAAEPSADGIQLVVQNRSEQVVELVLEARVEPQVAPSDTGARAGSAEPLRLDCAPSAPRCLSLVPGAELRPPAWPALAARGQCGSARPAALPGSYAFRVHGCAGDAVESASFALR